MKLSLARFLASGFGSGFIPGPTGTYGSFVILLIWYVLGDWYDARLGVSLVCIIGVWSSAVCLKQETGFDSGDKSSRDPSYIVIDEWAGMLISLWTLSPSRPGMAIAAFFLFRGFDVVKPGPVGWAERLPGAWGVMADDCLAGICTLASLYCMDYFGLAY